PGRESPIRATFVGPRRTAYQLARPRHGHANRAREPAPAPDFLALRPRNAARFNGRLIHARGRTQHHVVHLQIATAIDTAERGRHEMPGRAGPVVRLVTVG